MLDAPFLYLLYFIFGIGAVLAAILIPLVVWACFAAAKQELKDMIRPME
jgi:hypothetical protein